MKQQKRPPKTWDEFWNREIDYLSQKLASPLVGGSRASILCFQPMPKERLVYLVNGRKEEPREHSGVSHLCLRLDEEASQLLYGNSPELPWTSHLHSITQDHIKAHLENDRDVLSAIHNAERDRYDPYPSNLQTNFTRKGVKRRMQLIFPSPLYNCNHDWWRRLPRLGIAYTLDDQLGKPDGASANVPLSITDRLLMIMAVSTGNRVLAKRLRLIFNNSYSWPGESGPKQYFVELDIPTILGTRSADDCDDKLIFLIAKLILAHHLFFPHSPEALHLFQRLALSGCNDIMEMHGWPRPAREIAPTQDVAQSIDNLTADLYFLMLALVRWGDPTDNTASLQGVDYGPVIKGVVFKVLALLCGEPKWIMDGEYFTIVPPSALSALRKIEMPTFRKGQLGKLKGDPSYFLKVLSPLVGPKAPGWHKMVMDGVTFPLNDGVSEGRLNQTWTSKYLRARYLLATKNIGQVDVLSVNQREPLDRSAPAVDAAT